MVPSNRTKGNRWKMMHRKFHLTIRRNIFTVQVAKHWNRLPREVAESSPRKYSRISWTQSYEILWSRTILLEQGGWINDPLWSFPILPILWFCKVHPPHLILFHYSFLSSAYLDKRMDKNSVQLSEARIIKHLLNLKRLKCNSFSLPSILKDFSSKTQVKIVYHYLWRLV